MKTLVSLAAGLAALASPAASLAQPARLSPPLNEVHPHPVPDAPEETVPGAPSQRRAMVIGEDGTFRFLAPADPARPESFSESPASEFSMDLSATAEGPDSLRITARAANITETVTPDGSTRIIRIEPDDGTPSRLITITKD